MSCPSPHLSALSSLLLIPLPFFLLCIPGMAQERQPTSEPAQRRRAAMDAETAAVVARIDRARGAADLPETLVLEGRYEVFLGGAATAEPVAEGACRELFGGGGRARHTSDMGSYGNLERGTTPDLVWEVDPSLGAKRYDGPAGATVRRYFALLRGESPATLYARIARKGKERVGDVDCTVLEMQPAAGKADTWYVDPATGHVHRIDMALPSPDSAGAIFDMKETIDAKIRFGDWREVGDAAYPHRREIEMGPANVVMRFDEIVPGAALDSGEFAPPDAVKDLEPAVEGQPVGGDAEPTYLIVDREAQPVASIRVRCRPDEISATLAELLPEVMAHVTAEGAKIAGAPFSRYHGFTAEEVDLEAGIPIGKPIAEKGRVENSELPGGKVLTTWHIGPYEKLSAAHQALTAYAKANDLAARGGPWEIYWTDPGMVPDSSKWRTQLFLPIERR